VAVGLWLRDLLVLAASGSGDNSFLTELAVYSPLQAITTGLFALLILVAFREWFSIRLDA
jgi:TctA family transporter